MGATLALEALPPKEPDRITPLGRTSGVDIRFYHHRLQPYDSLLFVDPRLAHLELDYFKPILVDVEMSDRTMITGYCHELARSHGLAVLWATHLVDEVLPEDKLVILHKGRIIEDGICRDVVGRRKLGDRFAELTGDQAF